MVAVAASVMPAVSVCFTRRDRAERTDRIVGSALKTAALIIPSSGMIVLGTPITKLLFHSLDASVAAHPAILGLANIFVSLTLVCNSVLQSHGVLNIPIVIMLIGGVIIVIFDFAMVGNPSIQHLRQPHRHLHLLGIACILELLVVKRIVPRCPLLLKLFAKPLLASVVMGGAAWGSYGLLYRLTGSNTLSTLAAILLAVAIYGVLVIALKILTRDDLSLMPKGEKIARLLHIH